jgi:hypothetical protein
VSRLRRIGMVPVRDDRRAAGRWYAHLVGMRDTTSEASAVQAAVHRRLGGAGRFRVAVEISDLTRRWSGTERERCGRDGATTAPDCANIAPSSTGYGMNAGDVFARVLAALEISGVPHMLTGSFASSFHGVPRGTP